jgi:hypothetical protein
MWAMAQQVADTLQPASVLPILRAVSDTAVSRKPEAVALPVSPYQRMLDSNFYNHPLLATKLPPVSTSIIPRNAPNRDYYFYLLVAVCLLLAFLRFFYERYFNNLFRVFFNTSLRQSQLTDQLLQARLISGIFNLFFVVTAGLYVYFLLLHFGWVSARQAAMVMGVSVLAIGAIYSVKYFTLKTSGWLTGYSEVAGTYLFVIFLINKILGVLLFPLVVVLAFAAPKVQATVAVLSLLLIGIMFLLRFVRSYGLLRHKIKVSWFHFLLFIIGIEILPILLLYKGLLILLNKNI